MHGHRVQRENGESPKPERRVQPSENGREVTMKHRKGIVVLLLCAILALGMCAAMSHVSKAEDEYIIDMSDATSRVIIDATTGDGKPVVVTGNSSEYGLDISADSGENITVIFRNLTVDLSAVHPYNNAHAVIVEGEGNVTIQLEGKSCLTGGPMRSAIEKTVPRSLGSNGFEYVHDFNQTQSANPEGMLISFLRRNLGMN